MKHYKQTFNLILSCFLFIFLLPSKSFGQLSGNYTIDPSKSASSSNYQNWSSAVGDLLNGSRPDGGPAQGAGVKAAVTITVADVIYSGVTVELTAITGASSTNTITFKSAGGDSTKCTLRTACSSSLTNDYILMLNGADYVTFQEIGFERTGKDTACRVVVITNDADNNKFVRCFLKGRKIPSNATNGFAWANQSTISFAGNGDSTSFIQNRIMYGYNGIFSVYGSVNVLISGNIIDTCGSAGIYMTGQNMLRIMGNTFNMGDFGPGSGQYVSYGFRIEGSPSMVAANNKIFMTAVNGQVVRAVVIAGISSSAAAPAMVYNNFIVNAAGTTECTGFAVYGTYYLEIINNNVLIVSSLGNASGYYHYAAYTNSNISILNNNFINKGGGYAINVPGTNTADIDSLDYNNYFTNGKNIGNWGGTDYKDLSSMQSGSGRDAHSLSVDPGYTNTGNLHVANIQLNGKALHDSRMIADIDGETRDNSNPDIGADEFFPGNIDIGVVGLDSPYLFCPGKQNVKITFQNYGFDTIKSAEIQWEINGSAQKAYTWTGTLAPGQSSASLILGNFTFSSNTSYTFKLWTRLPNKMADEKRNNDTLRIIRLPAMGGAYTLGDTAGTDYKSFNQSITAMTERGICSAITFNVYKGIYKEQLTLVQLPGMGAASPVKFQNITNDSSKVVVTIASTIATGSNEAVIQLRGASYYTFKGITFERTGTPTNRGHVLHILNGAHHNTFTNGQMIGLIVTTANTFGYNILSDVGVDNYNTFRNNRIRFGYVNMSYLGTAGQHEIGNVIEGNIFEGSLNNSVLLQYNDSVTVKGNTFMNVNSHIVGNYSIQLSDCDKGIDVNGNFFVSPNTDTSLWLIGCNGTSAKYGIIANNSSTRAFGKAILLDGVDYQNVVFNSFYFNSNNTYNAAITTSGATSSEIVLKNNLIVMDGGIGFNINTPSQVSSSDNNNFVIKGGQFGYWGGAYNSLSSMSFASGMDLKSTTIDPLFIPGSNLHIKNYLLKGKGVPITGVTKDIDGEIRNATNPDIGADEFKLVANDAGVSAVYKPLAQTCAGVLDVWAIIKNFGNDNLKTATITWTVNGASQTPYDWKGNLKTNGLDTVKLGSFNFTTAFNPRFTVRVSLPNGVKDELSFNDSLIVTRTLRALPVANAGADMIICSGDTVTLGPGPSSGVTYKWMTLGGPVISTSSQVKVTPAATTKYVFEVTNTSFGCVRSDTVEISLNTKPTAFAGNNAIICPGTSIQIGEAPQTGFTYNWTSFPPGFTSSVANPSDIPMFTTTYIVEKTVTGSACKDIDTVIINVDVIPTPKITGKDKLCSKSIQTYVTNKNTGNNYKWLVSGGKILSGQNTNSINLEWNTSGFGSVKVVETNAAMCYDTAEFYVSVSSNPKADFSFKGTCLTDVSLFKNLSVPINDSIAFAWTFGDGITSTQENPSHTYAIPLGYNVRLVSKNIKSGCNDTITKLVPVEPLPAANFTYVQKPGNILDFTNTSTISTGSITSWNWKFGDGKDSSTLENPSHTFPNTATYQVTLCVKSVSGCENCVTKPAGFIGIKNPVTNLGLSLYPNPGSDIFTIESLKPMASVEVSNALGQIVSTYNPIASEFQFNLSGQPNGVYFIKIEIDGQSQVLRLIKE